MSSHFERERKRREREPESSSHYEGDFGRVRGDELCEDPERPRERPPQRDEDE